MTRRPTLTLCATLTACTALAACAPPPSVEPTAPPTTSVAPRAPLTTAPVTPILPSDIQGQPGSTNTPSTGGARIAPTSTGPLSGRRIVLDPGHNGSSPYRIMTMQVPAGNGRTKDCQTSGTANRKDHPEHAFTWDVVLIIASHLRAAGAQLTLTRPNDTGVGPCVNERAAIGNRAQADAVVSIHADGSEGPKHRGYHLITSPRMAGGKAATTSSDALASSLRTALDTWGTIPRSTYIGEGTGLSSRDDLAGLNLSAVPAVMIECGNMMNADDDAILDNRTHRQSLGATIATGIIKHLARTSATTPPSPTPSLTTR